MVSRFRIRPECIDDVLAALRQADIGPLNVYNRDDGAIAVEVGDLTDMQGQLLAAIFRPEWSAIIGMVGGDPFETKH